MSEEQKEEQQTQSTPADTGSGNNSQTIGIIERADAIVKRLEETEKRIDEKTQRYEQLLTRNLMSGRAIIEQNDKTPQQLEAERDAAEVQRILKRIGQ